jgi:hypothetical protein
MIHLLAPGDQQATANLVASALARSCGQDLLRPSGFAELRDAAAPGSAWVLIDPRPEWTAAVARLLQARHKLLVFGHISAPLAELLQMRCEPLSPALQAAAACAPAPSFASSESAARVVYSPQAVQRIAGHAPAVAERALRRYDFTDEWNNLGYGAIASDDSPWALAQLAQLRPEHQLASVEANGQTLSAYAGLWTGAESSLLWFNRSAGPIDSQEWRLVEDFLSCHRPDELPCWPVLAEVPQGFDAAVSMRLDCDEDIESARALWKTYQEQQVPFSLALHSKVLADPAQRRLPREVLAAGGALLSHTATHAPDWGGSYAAAFEEGQTSAAAIREATGASVRYAVSPFHQTPVYARLGLADAGYSGCIGGIIRNDFDFLMARAGVPPGSATGFIGHSQQCMLHGDCMLADGDPLRIFKQAFDMACAGGAFFGYLDHPFSERYQYGWTDEAQRIAAHVDLIAHMRRRGRVLFANEQQCMDFLWDRAQTRVQAEPEGFRITLPATPRTPWAIQLRYRGQSLPVPAGGLLS